VNGLLGDRMVQLICALALTWGTSSFGFDSTHAAWGKWLHDFTTENGPNTEVDYAKAKATPAPLTAYLKTLSDVTAAEYAAWPVNGRMAFLINSYNAFAIQLVVDHYPIGSIKELGNLLNNPWTKKFFQLLGKKQSLDGIEHGILRRDFTEPRALLALVSVSKGSPPLRSEPYVAGTLETQLDEAARRFIGDGLRNRYVAKDGKVYLSRVVSASLRCALLRADRPRAGRGSGGGDCLLRIRLAAQRTAAALRLLTALKSPPLMF